MHGSSRLKASPERFTGAVLRFCPGSCRRRPLVGRRRMARATCRRRRPWRPLQPRRRGSGRRRRSGRSGGSGRSCAATASGRSQGSWLTFLRHVSKGEWRQWEELRRSRKRCGQGSGLAFRRHVSSAGFTLTGPAAAAAIAVGQLKVGPAPRAAGSGASEGGKG